MDAVRLYGREDLRVENVSEPLIGDGELLIHTKAATICGTDIRIYSNGASHITGEHPVTLGHEVSGVIAEAAPGVRGRYPVGTRVAIAPNYGCGVCDRCVSGNTQLCDDFQAIGIHVDGGFAQYLRVPSAAVRQGNVAVLADSVSFSEAAMVEPLAAAYNAFERAHRRPGEVVLIIGAGPLGLMHAKLYAAAGAGAVIINDLLPERLDKCKQEDPSFVTALGDDVRDVVGRLTSGRGVDVSVTAAPSPKAQQLAVELTGLDGTVMLFGGLPKDKAEVPLDSNAIHYKQLYVTGVTRQSLRQYRESLELIATGRVNLKGVFTDSYPVRDAQSAFENVKQGRGLRSGFVWEN